MRRPILLPCLTCAGANSFTYRADLDHYLGIVLGQGLAPPTEEPVTPPSIGRRG